MKKRVNFGRIAVCTLSLVGMGGCQTVTMPKIDILKSPEFVEDAANIQEDYPRVRDAPI